MIKTDYALLTGLDPARKPVGFADLAGLARRIHRDRGRESLQLRNDRIRVQGHATSLKVVVVHAVDQTADRTRLIGYAYLRGGDRQRLEAALNETAPDLLEVA